MLTKLIPLTLLLSLSVATHAAVSSLEDLSATTLPNGLITLPTPGSQAAQSGDALKLSSGALTTLPVSEDGKFFTPADTVEYARTNKSADLQFTPTNDGTLWAFSGRISDLGLRTLAEAAALKPDAPMRIPPTSRNPEGALPNIVEGHTYLVQTTEGRYALVRALEKSKDALVLQFVYQNTGALLFDIPAAPLVAYQKPDPNAATQPAAGARAGAATPSATQPAFASRVPLGPRDRVEPGVIVLRGNTPPATGPSLSAEPLAGDAAMTAFTRQRDLLIQRRMASLQLPARTPGDFERKAQAAADLATLHADEAAELLVSQITFSNPRPTAAAFSQESFHPCFGALKKLGKPASTAALKALRTLDVAKAGATEGIDGPMYRAALLAAVIRAVEGDDIAQLLLTRDGGAETDPARKAVYDYVISTK